MLVFGGVNHSEKHPPVKPCQVLTVNPSLVTCLKLQHRAAPTEKNLVGALRVATGDWKARSLSSCKKASQYRFLMF